MDERTNALGVRMTLSSSTRHKHCHKQSRGPRKFSNTENEFNTSVFGAALIKPIEWNKQNMTKLSTGTLADATQHADVEIHEYKTKHMLYLS